MRGLSRRGLLAGAAAGLAAPLIAMPHRHHGHFGHHTPRSLRIAHVTDVHLKPEGDSIDRFATCLKAINSLHDKPDLLIQGGDVVMDAMAEGKERVQAQYDLASGLFDKYNDIPVEHCIGNHDIWGWGLADSARYEDHERFGKAWWLQWSGHKQTYRSFDAGGWHFVFLDSLVRQHKGVYTAKLDEEQFAWFEKSLQAVPLTTPVCVVSHVPLLSACSAFFGKYESEGSWHIPGALMHVDARKVKDLFVKHPNVRLCLSGHTHLLNKVEYNGVTHYCGGSVCGAWWNGPMQETKQGYSIVDLHPDGHFSTHYVTY